MHPLTPEFPSMAGQKKALHCAYVSPPPTDVTLVIPHCSLFLLPRSRSYKQCHLFPFREIKLPLLFQVPGDRAPADSAHVDVTQDARACRHSLAVLCSVLLPAGRHLQLHGGAERIRGKLCFCSDQCHIFADQNPLTGPGGAI